MYCKLAGTKERKVSLTGRKLKCLFSIKQTWRLMRTIAKMKRGTEQTMKLE